MSLYDRLLPLLPRVKQPQRYAGVEMGAYSREGARLKAALVFPDLYEIGMAHTGFQLLYHIGNSIPGVFLQRAFAPWTDMGALMRQEHLPLFTTEAFDPVGEMPLVAFTLPTDLHFTNLLYCLDLAGIPLMRSERDHRHPIILVGGLAAANPAPLLDFVDVFAIGDGELLLPRVLHLFLDHPEWSRKEKLQSVSRMEGFLVPGISPGPARRVDLKDLNEGAFDFPPVLPAFPSVHHRFNVELMRGCAWGCRFCEAGYWYRPLRERDPSTVRDMLLRRAPRTGFSEIGLLSLSTADYSPIEPLAGTLLETFEDRGISLSLPSLRVNAASLPILQRLQQVRKSGLTFAPECGESLRPHLNKAVTDAEILDAVARAKSLGWRAVKLYFILGLPFETEANLDEIAALVRKVQATGIRTVTVHAANFVPKPWTPFQWAAAATVDHLRGEQATLRQLLPRRGVELKLADPVMSHVEALFSRGDESMGEVLLEAYRRGCVFDNWTETFQGKVWTEVLPPPRLHAQGDELPWERHVDSGLSKAFLLREWDKALKGEFSPSCRTSCLACGLGRAGEDLRISKEFRVQSSKFKVEIQEQRTPAEHKKDPSTPASGLQPSAFSLQPEDKARYLLHFTKTGRARFLSYRYYVQFIVEGLQRAGAPLAFTQGFNPRPLLSTAPALPVGIESRDEVLELVCAGAVDWTGVEFDADGVKLMRTEEVQEGGPALSKRLAGGRYRDRDTVLDLPSDAPLKGYDPEIFVKLETLFKPY